MRTETINISRIENNFSYHPPFGDQAERYNAIRVKAKELAVLIEVECPQSRETSLAITHIETAVMWANAAIARNEKPVNETPVP